MRKPFTSTLLLAAGALGLASVAGSAGAVTLDATGTTFRFGYDGQTVTDSDDLGYGGYPEGTSLRYDEVATIDGTVIDAVVTFVDGTDLFSYDAGEADRLERIDDTFPDDEEDPFIELALGGNAQGGFAIAEMSVEFFEGGTNTPVTLSNLPMNVYDIDNLQWVEVDGAAGYSVSTNTHLTVTNPSSGTYRFTSPDESTDNDDGTSYTVGRGKVIFNATSEVTFRVAIPNEIEPGGSFDVDFSNGLPWTDQFGGGENTTNLPETGMAVGILAGLSVAMIAAGAALGARRRLRA